MFNEGATMKQFNLLFFVCVMIAVIVVPAMGLAEIILMGGNGDDYPYYKNDTWNSTDMGTTWNLVNASSGWINRTEHCSVVTPDGTIVLMGGEWRGFGSTYYVFNDTWQSTDHGRTWLEVNTSSGWSKRSSQTCLAMPDGSIILMGGIYSEGVNHFRYNDTWRSIDKGATWAQQTASAGWTARNGHSSVAMPDGSIVLMGGYDRAPSFKNDVWQSTDFREWRTRLNAPGVGHRM
jgi:hypothetical protein